MKPRTATQVSWALWISTMLVLTGTLALLILNRSLSTGGILYGYVALAIATLAYATAGALIIARVRGNPIGWALAGIGLALGLAGFGEQYLLRGLVTAPGSLPGTSFVTWLEGWTLLPAIAAIPIVFLLFPTGRVFSPRWRWILRIALAVLVVGVVGEILYPNHVDGITNSLGDQGLHLINPTSLRGAKGFLDAILGAAGFTGLAAGILSIASLVWRFRRAGSEERVQIKWLAFVAVTTLVLLAVSVLDPLFVGRNSVAGDVIFGVMVSFVFLGIPAAVTIAILKYRLYDIDVVIRKAIVVGVMAAFITAVYAGIVAAGSRIFTSTTSSFLAAAVLAVGFQPARARARRVADRLVYGKRATPYEVLAAFSNRMGESYAAEDVLPRMAGVLGQGAGAEAATVWLRVGIETRPVATWPADAAPAEEHLVEVRHRGEVLGGLGVRMPASDPMNPAKSKLMEDLASQAGLVLRNVRLIEEVRESRRRIVAAQDERAKKLERNIHDGAQQQLVALSVKQRLLAGLIGTDDARARAMAEQLQTETGEALENLRDLARGIYPPLLADRGLSAALEAQARKSPVPARVEADGIGRFAQEVEAAVYFCVLEALQNVAKYAEAAHVTVRLAKEANAVTFEVADDGRGFDPDSAGYGTGLQGMADRLEALGGSLEVRSRPGAGSTIVGRVLVEEQEPAE